MASVILLAVGSNGSAQRADGGPGLVQFPDVWRKNGVVLNMPAAYETRQLPHTAEILFALRSPDGSFSDNVFAISLDNRLRTRPASWTDWNEATPVVQTKRQVNTPDSPQDPVMFRDRTFTKSGDSWGRVLSSPSERWIALLSYTSKHDPKQRMNPMVFLGGGEPSNGELFVDVYDASSGEKMLGAHAPYAGFGPKILFENAFWGDDNYVVFPLDTLLRTCFLEIVGDR